LVEDSIRLDLICATHRSVFVALASGQTALGVSGWIAKLAVRITEALVATNKHGQAEVLLHLFFPEHFPLAKMIEKSFTGLKEVSPWRQFLYVLILKTLQSHSRT